MINITDKNIYITNNVFNNNPYIVNVDLCGKPWVGNSMYYAFWNCQNLASVKNINENVTTMAITFRSCYGLINAPEIPNKVTTLHQTFYDCQNLVNPPTIPNSVITLGNTFQGCYKLASAPVIPNSVTDMKQSFQDCHILTDAPNIPNSVTDMSGTFSSCYKLVNVNDIPNSVTNMSYTFYFCNTLENAPNIPNSVTNMSSTFSFCLNLINPPTISNGVVNMYQAFSSCRILENAPVIPDSVVDMHGTFGDCHRMVTAPILPKSVVNADSTFYNCGNISGSVYIKSENIINAINCFHNTFLRKNVYIPFTYENGVNTVTYNSFTSAGYDTLGTTDNVYLVDFIEGLRIEPTPSDSRVMMAKVNTITEMDLSDWSYIVQDYDYELQAYTGSNTDINIPSKFTETNVLKTAVGDTVEYIVSKDGYYTKSGTAVDESHQIVPVVLDEVIPPSPPVSENATLTIRPLPTDSNVEITVDGITYQTNTITVPKGTSVTYKVSRQYHTSKIETITVDYSNSIIVPIEVTYFTFTIETPATDADIEILVNGKLANASNDDWIFTSKNLDNDIEIQEYIGSDADIVIPTQYNVTNSVSVTYADRIDYKVSLPNQDPIEGSMECLEEDVTIYIKAYDVTNYDYNYEDGNLTLRNYKGTSTSVDVIGD